MFLIVSLVATAALIGTASATTCQIAPNGAPCTCVNSGSEAEADCASLLFPETGYNAGGTLKRFPPTGPTADLRTNGFPDPHLGGSPSVVFNGRCIGGLKRDGDGELLNSDEIENYYTCRDFGTGILTGNPVGVRKRDTAVTVNIATFEENNGCCVLAATSTTLEVGPPGPQGLPGSVGAPGSAGVIVPSLHCSYSITPGTAAQLHLSSTSCSFGAQPAISKRNELSASAGEHVSVSVSAAYERTTSDLDSDSEGSRLTPASRCGPHLTLYVDDKIAFKSNKAIFASQGVVSGQFQLDLNIATPHKFKLVVTSDHCTSNGLDIKIFNPVVSVALLGASSADQPMYYAGNSLF